MCAIDALVRLLRYSVHYVMARRRSSPAYFFVLNQLRPFHPPVSSSSMLEPLLRRARVYAKRSRFLRFGLPFLSFMVLGSFGLAEFTDIRVR